jgi:hypothetical protein
VAFIPGNQGVCGQNGAGISLNGVELEDLAVRVEELELRVTRV